MSDHAPRPPFSFAGSRPSSKGVAFVRTAESSSTRGCATPKYAKCGASKVAVANPVEDSGMRLQLNEHKFIFCTGAPGSTWSILIKQLAACPSVDRSDEREDRIYKNHFGNYFGPDMGFGEYFDDLPGSGRTREEILEELAKPYAEPSGNGFRMFKSHHFAYNLAFLRQAFPTSRFLLIYRNDEDCFKWWIQAGGFSITYPSYTWYCNDEVMKEKIRQENVHIRDFARHSNIHLTALSIETVARRLGLITADERIPSAAPPANGVLMGVL